MQSQMMSSLYKLLNDQSDKSDDGKQTQLLKYKSKYNSNADIYTF